MTPHEALVAAKGYLLRYGWRQDANGYGHTGVPQCSLGALKVTMGMEWHTPVAESAVASFVDAARLAPTVSIPTWNDAPERTLDDVIAVFDAAIIATAPALDDKPIFEALENLPAETQADVLSELALMPAEALHA